MPDFDGPTAERLLRQLVDLAPWAGGLIAGAVALRIMEEKPSELLRALAQLLWGWKHPKR